MAAVGVAQAAGLIVVFGKEERSVGAVGRVLAEEAVDRLQQPLRFFDRHGALTAQIGLQIGHEESGGNSLAGNVADYQAKPLLAQSQEIVVIATHLAGLNAASCVIQGFQGRQMLGKESSLYLFRDLELLGDAALRFCFLGHCAALRLDGASHFVEADQREGIAVEVFEAGENNAPELRDGEKLDAPARPFPVAGDDIVGHEDDIGGAANEFELLGIRRRSDEREHGIAIRRSDCQPSFAGLEQSIRHEMKAELVEIESQALLLVADEDLHTVNAEKLIRRLLGRRSHGPDYKADCARRIELEFVAVSAARARERLNERELPIP